MSRDLAQTFYEIQKHYNAADYDALLPLLHQDLIVKRIDDPGSVAGLGNVMAYLKGRQAQYQPQLHDVHIDFVHGGDGTHGIISGTAQYQDRKSDPHRRCIRYTFTFTRDSDREDWLLVNGFAAPSE